MDHRAKAWYDRRTSHWSDWPLAELIERKQQQGTQISVVIPARDEERTVASIVSTLARALVSDVPLVDELVVIDSDSTDATAEVASAAGATVFRARDVVPALGAYKGKGEALWKSLLITRGDVLVFVDADLTLWDPYFGLCREFCDVLRTVRFLGAVPLAACAGNVTIWDSCGASA